MSTIRRRVSAILGVMVLWGATICLPAAAQEGADAVEPGASPLTVTIDLPATGEGAVFNLEKPPRLIVENVSPAVVRLWGSSPYEDPGRLTWHFRNQRTGVEHVISEIQVIWPGTEVPVPLDLVTDSEAVMNSRRLEHHEQLERFTLPPTMLPETGWSRNRLPVPNSSDTYSIFVELRVDTPRALRQATLWNGVLRSATISATVVAPGILTAQDYLDHGFVAEAIRLCVADPATINRRDRHSETPLHVAVRRNCVEEVQWLLQHGAGLSAINEGGWTPLHLASSPEVAELLLAQGADMKAQGNRPPLQTPLELQAESAVEAPSRADREQCRLTGLRLLSAGADCDLLSAIRLDAREQVRKILQEMQPAAIRAMQPSPLRMAANANRLEICRELLNSCLYDVDDLKAGHGYSILKQSLGQPEIARLLIEHGADVRQRVTWFGGRSGIWVIGENATLLHHAAAAGTPEIVQLLLDRGVNPHAVCDETLSGDPEMTALDVAAFYHHDEILQVILSHPTFLKGDAGRRRALLNKCLLQASQRSGEGRTSATVEVLLKNGGDANLTVRGWTAMQLLAKVAAFGTVHTQRDAIAAMRVLLNHGAELDLHSAIVLDDLPGVLRLFEAERNTDPLNDLRGLPALHLAVLLDRREMLSLLLRQPVFKDTVSSVDGQSGWTALHVAARENRVEAAELLIAQGAPVDVRNAEGQTPLHVAARYGQLSMARLLLSQGATAELRDHDGNTARQVLLSVFSDQRQALRELLEAAEKARLEPAARPSE